MIVVLNLFISVVVIILLQILGMVVFSWMTPYREYEELKSGNLSVGLVLAGKFLGTAIILGVAAYTNTSIWFMMLWFAVGYVCLIVVYWIFEWMTPFKASEQVQKGNTAVGALLCAIFVGTAFAVSSLIV